MQKIRIEYSHNGAVAGITLCDGKGNVLDGVMMQEIQETLEECAGNNGLKLIVFDGDGKHFSFGASVEEHQKGMVATMLRNFHALFYTLRDLSVPTLCKLHGQCLGGGLELALMCNFLFADKTATLGQPEIVLGVFPPPASIILTEKIGLARAEELLLTGKSIGADKAHASGLINTVYEDRSAMDAGVSAFIEKYILPKSASSLRFAVKAARVKFNNTLSTFLPMLEQMYVDELMSTKDANEGITAFLEKRAPAWQDC
jgi:cyclohexa-1,5-dienecarbonyl-CoA hydratase